MATPIGHSLFGLLIARTGGYKFILDWHWYVLCIIAANAADFDFLPGILRGDINLYHHGVSHSIFAGLAFSLIFCALFRFSRQHYPLATLLCALAYWSHLLIDMLAVDKREPYGIPILWPASTEYMRLPWEFLAGVKHGVPGDSFTVFISQLVTLHNLETLFIESVIFLPLFVALAVFKKRFSLKRKSGQWVC